MSALAALALIGPIHSVLAAPPSSNTAAKAATALDVPGLGVELEITQIQYDSLGKKYSDMDKERKEKLKGANILPIGFGNDHPKNDWDITAELGGTGLPYTEIISNGKKNEIGKHGTVTLGKQITTYMVCLRSYYPTFVTLSLTYLNHCRATGLHVVTRTAK